MENLSWYSAKLRFVVLVESKGGTTLNDCIFVFKAAGFPEAFDRAIVLGRAKQKEYLNSEERQVRWRFLEVLTLDVIASTDLDGAEIHSQFLDLDQNKLIPFDAEFRPEDSTPEQTI